jgi:hypothetical protein
LTGKAYKYTADTGAFGIQLSAQSGFSTNVELHWQFGDQPYRHSLFGHGNPPTVSPIIYAY